MHRVTLSPEVPLAAHGFAARYRGLPAAGPEPVALTVLARPPPLEAARVDGAAGLDVEIDCIGKPVLAAVGGLNEVTGVDDREAVRDRRADEARAARHENALVLH